MQESGEDKSEIHFCDFGDLNSRFEYAVRLAVSSYIQVRRILAPSSGQPPLEVNLPPFYH